MDDWPSVTDPSDLDLLRSYLGCLAHRPSLDPTSLALITAGLSTDSPATLTSPTGRTLLGLGDPRLPYSLFECPPTRMDLHVELLPLQLTGDPRLRLSHDYTWTDLLLIGRDPNYAYLDQSHGLLPITIHNSSREEERTRWALHSLCQATIEALAIPPPRLRRLPRGRATQPLPEAPPTPRSTETPPSHSLLPSPELPSLPNTTGGDFPPAPSTPAAAVSPRNLSTRVSRPHPPGPGLAPHLLMAPSGAPCNAGLTTSPSPATPPRSPPTSALVP